MKRLALCMLPVLALVASPALSQQAQTAATEPGMIIAAQEEGQLRADNLLGAKVKTGSGKEAKDIGVIQDLLFDRDYKLVGAVIGMGGFLGMGERSVAVSWNSLEKVEQNSTISFVTKLPGEQLEQAPTFKSIEEQKAELARQQRLEQQRQRSTTSPGRPATN